MNSAVYAVQSALSEDTTYYWRSYRGSEARVILSKPKV